MEHIAERDLRHAMTRGFKRCCPRCGRGRIFDGYLAVRKDCTTCGLDLTPQRADDGPAYLTIVVVGHLLVPLMVPVYRTWEVHPAVVATAFSALAVLLSLILLPRLKGALIGVQWAKRMHGF